jgi:hypothetical protein
MQPQCPLPCVQELATGPCPIQSTPSNPICFSDIWGSHGGEDGVLGSEAVWSCTWLPANETLVTT